MIIATKKQAMTIFLNMDFKFHGFDLFISSTSNFNQFDELWRQSLAVIFCQRTGWGVMVGGGGGGSGYPFFACFGGGGSGGGGI